MTKTHAAIDDERTIDDLRERVDNIAAVDNIVLTTKAAHLLDQLIDEWANCGAALADQ